MPADKEADTDDSILVARAQQGDARAFEELVRRYHLRVLKLVRRYVNGADAEDIAQESFIKAWRALPRFRGNSAFFTWLYRIAVNTAKNHLSSAARRPVARGLEIDDVEEYGLSREMRDIATPEAVMVSEEVEATVMRAIRELPDDLRTAISLRELEGMSYDEIATVMDCPIGTVRSRIFRARDAVDAALQSLVDADDETVGIR